MGLLRTLVDRFLFLDDKSRQKTLTPTNLRNNQEELDTTFKQIYDELGAFHDSYLTHTHDAADIVSGTMDINRLGSGGTGAGIKVLHDDNTWKIPSGGSGGGSGAGAIIDLGSRITGLELIDVGTRL